MEIRWIRVRDYVYPTREAAIAAGWDDAEFGFWVPANGDQSKGREGWIALQREEAA